MRARTDVALAYAQLVITAVVWGVAFVAQRDAMRYVPPFLFNGCRFALAAAAILCLIWWRGRGVYGAVVVRSGLILGGLLWIAASLQQVGMVYTTAGKGGFITGLYMVVVPLLLLSTGRVITRWAWSGVGCAALGLYLLSGGIDAPVNIGDMLVLCCAVAFAAHVLATESYAQRADPLPLAFVQFTTCAALSLLTASLYERVELSHALPALPSIAYGGLVSIGLGYTLQLAAQRYVAATPAALILSLESVVAAAAGWLLLEERLSTPQVLGCALMLLGIVLAQLPIRKNAVARTQDEED